METQALLAEMARTQGWIDDTLPKVDASSGLDPQRIWFRKSLRGTKYEGAMRPKNKVRCSVSALLSFPHPDVHACFLVQRTLSVDDAGNGIPDGLLFAAGDDIKNRDLVAVIELKATPKQKADALKELDGYCSSSLLNSNNLGRVLGIAAAGNRATGLTVEVVSYNREKLKGMRQPVKDTNGAFVKTSFPRSRRRSRRCSTWRRVPARALLFSACQRGCPA